MTTYTLVEIQEHRNEWTRALVSGDYEQAKGRLVTVDHIGTDGSQEELSYCCLGVAFDVAGSKLENPFHRKDDYFCDDKFENWAYDDETYTDSKHDEKHFAEDVLNEEMKEYLGLADWMQTILIQLNDEGVEFHVISDVIDEFPVYIDGKPAS